MEKEKTENTKENLKFSAIGQGLLFLIPSAINVCLSQNIILRTTIPGFIISSLTSLNVIVEISNYKKMDKNPENYKEMSSFTKKVLKIRKKLISLLLGLNITLTAINGFYVGRKSLLSAQANKNNPFNNQQLDIETEKSEIDFLLESIDNNLLLTEEEKEQVHKLEQFYKENPYLNYEDTYYDFATVDVFYTKSITNEKNNVIAECAPDLQLIRVYDKSKTDVSLPHEFVHLLGRFKTRFLKEGMTTLIVAEYCQDGQIKDGYGTEVYLTEIVIELAGKDIVLQAFSSENEEMLIDSLAQNMEKEKVENLLIELENYAHQKEQFTNEKINRKEFYEQFTKTGQKLFEYIENTDIIEFKKHYIYYCYICSSELFIEQIPKFNLNQQKNQSYPMLDLNVISEYFKTEIADFTEIDEEKESVQRK